VWQARLESDAAPPSKAPDTRGPGQDRVLDLQALGRRCEQTFDASSALYSASAVNVEADGDSMGREQGCTRREGTSEAAPEAARRAVGGGCQNGWGRLLSITNPIEAGTCHQGDSGECGRYLPPLPM